MNDPNWRWSEILEKMVIDEGCSLCGGFHYPQYLRCARCRMYICFDCSVKCCEHTYVCKTCYETRELYAAKLEINHQRYKDRREEIMQEWINEVKS